MKPLYFLIITVFLPNGQVGVLDTGTSKTPYAMTIEDCNKAADKIIRRIEEKTPEGTKIDYSCKEV